MLRSSLVVILGLSTGAVVGDAHASLTLTINTLTTDEFSFTLAGTFDADVIGDQTSWLAIKNDWSNNFGLHTHWIDSSVGFWSLEDPRLRLTVVENSVTFNGAPPGSSIVSALDENSWGDSFYFDAGFPIPAGTVVAGTLTVTGTNVFLPSQATALELLSGFDDANVDWARLEAVAGTACPWDLDNSGSVGTGDLLDLLSQWGDNPGGPPDFDGSGSVGTADLLKLLANWGPCP